MRKVTVTFTAEQAEFVRNILKSDLRETERYCQKGDALTSDTMRIRGQRCADAIEVLTAALED